MDFFFFLVWHALVLCVFFFVSHSLFVQPVLTDCRLLNGPQKATQDVVETRSENIYLILFIFSAKAGRFFF